MEPATYVMYGTNFLDGRHGMTKAMGQIVLFVNLLSNYHHTATCRLSSDDGLETDVNGLTTTRRTKHDASVQDDLIIE